VKMDDVHCRSKSNWSVRVIIGSVNGALIMC